MHYLLDVVYLFVGLCLSPMILYRRFRHGRYQQGWGHRFGWVNRRFPERDCIWLHAVSVGEMNAARHIVTELQQRYPQHEIVISTTTDTGQARAQALCGEDSEVFYFPLDFSWVMKRVFKRLNPSLVLLMELEVWPHLTMVAERRGCPIVVVNGRISDSSIKSYRRFKALMKPVFNRVTLALAQTQEYADRFKELGCASKHVVITGSLKYDTAQIADIVPGADELAKQIDVTAVTRLWIAGGTGTDEEALILKAHTQLVATPGLSDLRLVIVPRKPERFDQVAQLIEQTGFPVLRYSILKAGGEATVDPKAVILGDTMGDLRKFYSLATVAFVGRSLVPMGGSDMMEVAALGKPTLFGPHAFNFKQTVEVLLAGHGAIEVCNVDDLVNKTKQCLTDQHFSKMLSENGQKVIKDNQGATERTLQLIQNLLESTS